MDIITYALLKKKITSALSGVSDIKLEGNQTIVFTTNDGKDFKIHIPTPDLVYVGSEEPPKDSEYELWIDTSSEGTTSLNKAILTEEIVASTVIGSVTAGKVYPIGTDLEQIIRDILTSYSKPTIILSADPTKDLYDIVTETLDKITSIAKVTKGTNNIQSIKFFVDNVEDKEIIEGVAAGGTFSNIHQFETPANKTFILKCTVNDGKNNTTATKTITFIGKSYYGTVEGEEFEITEDIVKNLQFNTLKNSRALIYSDIKVDYGKIVYAYPAELGALTKIIDDNNNDGINSYDMKKITIDELDYYCYVLKDAIGTDGAYQKYS